MEATHTPGPFLLVNLDAECAMIVPDIEAVDREQVRADEATGGDIKWQVMPLFLAAAAPAMLEALKAVKAWMDDRDGVSISDAGPLVEAAIHQAEGGAL